MHADQMNEIINDQEESISKLEDKLLAAEADRDDARERIGELVKALTRIAASESLEGAKAVAGEALKEKE